MTTGSEDWWLSNYINGRAREVDPIAAPLGALAGTRIRWS
jgi:hypothetical protein